MRTDTLRIRQVLETSLDDSQLNAFATDASAWVTANLSDAGLANVQLEMIERYLACALATFRDPRLVDSSLADVKEKAQRDPVVSEYLTAAASFDPTNTVRAAFLPPKNAFRGMLIVGSGFARD
jgi:hypothetical protein